MASIDGNDRAASITITAMTSITSSRVYPWRGMAQIPEKPERGVRPGVTLMRVVPPLLPVPNLLTGRRTGEYVRLQAVVVAARRVELVRLAPRVVEFVWGQVRPAGGRVGERT